MSSSQSRVNLLRISLIFFVISILFQISAAQGPEISPTAAPASANPTALADPSDQPTGFNGAVPFIETINDPIEPFNRAMFAFNDRMIQWFINPLAKGYRKITPEPARTGIRKMGVNLGYPVRLFNNLFQGKGTAALSETGRFLVNTTVGLLGIFDPATRMGLKAYDEDFGQTLGSWGYKPGFYFVIPFLGPSSGRDTLGSLFDAALDPATYIPGGAIFKFNNFSFTLPAYEQLRTEERDLYVLARDATSLKRKKDTQDFVVNVQDIDPDPTLKSIFLKPQDQAFQTKMTEFDAVIPTTHKRLPYSAWLQSYPSSLIFIVGGTGSHRMSQSTMALAEIFYRDNFSVVTISNSMNWEFMENAAEAAVPGYPPSDAQDVYRALDSIYQDLRRRFPGRFTKSKALLGTSLGGIHTLYIASFADRMPPSYLRFDRYIALDAPTDLIYAMQNLDNYYNAPLQWRPEERRKKIEDTLLKAVAVSENTAVDPSADLPFNKIESRYLIGMTFKLVLRDVIYSSQKRESLGVLQDNFHTLSRNDMYREIVKYGFMDYINVFLIPYYMNHPNFRYSREKLLTNSSLRPIENELKNNPKIRAFINENDFFLRPEDFQWYKKIISDKRLTVLSTGGHMGNLYLPEVQNSILNSVVDIKALTPEK